MNKNNDLSVVPPAHSYLVLSGDINKRGLMFRHGFPESHDDTPIPFLLQTFANKLAKVPFTHKSN